MRHGHCRFSRLWVLDIPGLEDTTALTATTRSVLAADYREVFAKPEHGVVIRLYEAVAPPSSLW
jgi:hypothetical protein